jgi:hypothetical protein
MKAKFDLQRSGARLLTLAVIACLSAAACLDFWNIPWGKGLGGNLLSIKWGLAFLFLVVLSILLLALVSLPLWTTGIHRLTAAWLTNQRAHLGVARWFVIIASVLIPNWLLGYTIYGAILTSLPLHLLLWVFTSVLIGFLLTQNRGILFTWPNLLAGILITGCGFTLADSFSGVTTYPFSTSWSEGNRIWDYSVLFGHHLYNYPADQKIFAYIDFGRQFLWGLPFLLPHVTIAGFRFWNALMYILPYTLLGWIVMKSKWHKLGIWMLAGLWAYLFLNMGGIYSTLIISAILVVLAWRRSLWIAVPLLMLAGYFTTVSRLTWIFAPAIWAGMLELGSAVPENGQLRGRAWGRAISTGVAGLVGSFVIPSVKPSIIGFLTTLFNKTASIVPTATPAATPVMTTPIVVPPVTPAVTATSIQHIIIDQPLLWYRLFPNTTYPPGILLGLLIAVGPLCILLIYLVATRRWQLSIWQKLGILGPLLAFLVVGLIVSVKIGGGSDLHNMDMFIIGLLFAAAIAWHKEPGKELILQSETHPVWVKLTLVLLIAIPSFQPLANLHPSLTTSNFEKISTLASSDYQYPLLPSESDVQIVLDAIRANVALAQTKGDILFMDQRQLLTFGYFQNIPLIPDYEKKYMMDRALSGAENYFAGYYRDLANKRFSLIITEPLRINYQSGSSNDFPEENDAWVKWVSEPTLCFYEPLLTFENMNIQLLIPRQDISACGKYLNLGQP